MSLDANNLTGVYMPVGQCKMCLKDKALVRSHLMPAALYDYCRPPGGGDPVKVSSEIVMSTSRQTQDYLLCIACEDVLNQGGEKWVLPKLATYEKSFPLYDIIAKATPEWEEPDMAAYAGAKISALDIHKVVHFAMGIFWKASVHSWKKANLEPRITLGPYSDAIRKYLLGHAGFPPNVTLMVNLRRPANAMIVFSEPLEATPQGGWRTHFFQVPGIIFIMNVGKQVSHELRVGCFATNVHHPIAILEGLNTHIENRLKAMYLEAPKSRKYLQSRQRYLEAKKARKLQ
jgi:hypothetical protein